MTKEIRISVTELIEIVSYALPPGSEIQLRKHWEAYHDYPRIKDSIIKGLASNRAETKRLADINKQLTRKCENLQQIDWIENKPK